VATVRIRIRFGLHFGNTKTQSSQLILLCPQEFGTEPESVVNTSFLFLFTFCIVLLVIITFMLRACKSKTGV